MNGYISCADSFITSSYFIFICLFVYLFVHLFAHLLLVVFSSIYQWFFNIVTAPQVERKNIKSVTLEYRLTACLTRKHYMSKAR